MKISVDQDSVESVKRGLMSCRHDLRRMDKVGDEEDGKVP